MSKESIEWLRSNIRIGFTGADGPAWWANQSEFMADGTHFDGPVPVEEVRRILSVPLVEATLNPVYTFEGNREVADDGDRKGIVRADTGQLLGVFKKDYVVHGYQEWTLHQIQSILDTSAGELGVKSVGLLRKGGVAWLQVRLNESFEVEGFGYTPFITAATSCDGTLSSTYVTGVDAAVCDNTLSQALSSAQTKLKIRHSSKSAGRTGEVRDALGLVYTAGEGFKAAAEELLSVPVTPAEFAKWLDMTAPLPEKKSDAKPGRGYTMASNKRDALSTMYASDPKVAPWAGTAFGVMQLDNTYRTWTRTVQGADGGRMERNLHNMVQGITEKEDQATLDTLSAALGRQLLAA